MTSEPKWTVDLSRRRMASKSFKEIFNLPGSKYLNSSTYSYLHIESYHGLQSPLHSKIDTGLRYQSSCRHLSHFQCPIEASCLETLPVETEETRCPNVRPEVGGIPLLSH
jgi:hypothetical protein